MAIGRAKLNRSPLAVAGKLLPAFALGLASTFDSLPDSGARNVAS